ncbi:hypothetical protein TNCV_2014191 [Trichonephila clavipes]|nr:hypothetical protein TNCV_2014191 [Trichonephila clavipes]
MQVKHVKAPTFSRWWGVEVVFVTGPWFKTTKSPAKSPRVALKCNKIAAQSVRVVVYCASPPQVRGSNPGLVQVDSAFIPFSGSINEYQACLGTEHWGFRVRHTTRPKHLHMHPSA